MLYAEIKTNYPLPMLDVIKYINKNPVLYKNIMASPINIEIN